MNFHLTCPPFLEDEWEEALREEAVFPSEGRWVSVLGGRMV